MTQSPDIERFLSSLSARRARLEQRVESGLAFEPATMLREITELTEQLLVADEELRAQQDELERTRGVVERLAAQHDQLFVASPEALLYTDLQGVVLTANPAARRLLGEREHEITPIRPIATKFSLDHRPAVRALITRATQSTEAQRADVAVRRTGGPELACQVTVHRVTDATGPDSLLWSFHPRTPDSAAQASEAVQLIVDLARQLAQTPVEEQPGAVVRLALNAIPAAEHAGLIGYKRHRDAALVGATVLAASDDRVRRCALVDRYQPGPGTQALLGGVPVVIGDTLADQRWPRHGEETSRQGFRSVLACPVAGGKDNPAALMLYARTPGAFSDGVSTLAGAFAVEAGTVLAAAGIERNLRIALESREQIGQAIGILVERHRIIPQQAFDMLVHVSQTRHQKLRDVAGSLIETGEL